MSSMPTDRRTVAGEMPARSRPCSSDCEWVVVAGWTTSERTSPMLARLECSFRASMNAQASSWPPTTSKERTEPVYLSPSFCLVSYHGEDSRPA